MSDSRDDQLNTESDSKEAMILSEGDLDEYKLAQIGFSPDVIYDIGADVGSVSLFAHKTHPKAKIVAVEPHDWSYERLAVNVGEIPEIIPVHAAIGQGQMYEPKEAEPMHWMVVGKDAPTWNANLVETDTPAITLSDLHSQHGGNNYVVKLDIEGGEHDIIAHAPSRKILLDSSYFAAEFHVWGATREPDAKVSEVLLSFLFDLSLTHTIYSRAYGACMHVWATRSITHQHVVMKW